MNQQWVEQSRTRNQVLMDGDDPKAVELWPAPCELCKVSWKLTPAGRWRIEHDYGAHVSRSGIVEEVIPPTRTGQAERVSAVLGRIG